MVDILSYLEEAKAFAADAKGALLLYISDTLTAQYPALQALIDAVHPAAVIHTGDSVDEYKVGRLEADRIPYEAGMKELMEILGSADCPLYFTSGNNDDLTLITDLPDVTVVPNHTVIEVEGVKPVENGSEVLVYVRPEEFMFTDAEHGMEAKVLIKRFLGKYIQR